MKQEDNVCLYCDPPASAELPIHIRHATATVDGSFSSCRHCMKFSWLKCSACLSHCRDSCFPAAARHSAWPSSAGVWVTAPWFCLTENGCRRSSRIWWNVAEGCVLDYYLQECISSQVHTLTDACRQTQTQTSVPASFPAGRLAHTCSLWVCLLDCLSERREVCAVWSH